MVPLIERLAADGLTVSVDTWRAPVARAALHAGAGMVNDVSGLSDPGVASACAEAGARLVITHTRVPPKVKGFPRYEDVVSDVSRVPSRARGAGRGARGGRGRARLRPRHGPEQVPGRVDRAAAPAARAGRPGPAAAGGGVAQGLRGRADRASARRARRRDAGCAGHRRGRRRGHPAGTRRGRGARFPAGARGAARRRRPDRSAAAGSGCAGRPCEQVGVHHRPPLRSPLRISLLRAQPARPGARGDQRARARPGDRVRRPHRRRPAGRVPARARLPRPGGLRADDRDPRQPRLAQRRLRALRGALRRAQLGAARATGCRSWRSTRPNPISTTG